MEKSFHRSSRIALELQKNIAIIVYFYLKDPRIQKKSIVSAVKVSKDLSYAKVFISFSDIKNNLHIKNTIILLNKASGYIRKILCTKMKLRIIPNIIFLYDDSFFQGNKISLLLNKIIKKTH